jgi:ATP/ADP translocase
MKTKQTDLADKTPEEIKRLRNKLRLFLLFNYILWPSLAWLFYSNVQSTPIIERQKKFTWAVIIISIVVSGAAYVATEITSHRRRK